MNDGRVDKESTAPKSVYTRRDDERELIARASSGDHEAFVTLIKSVDEKLRQLVFGIVREQSAMQDVMQEAYLKAFRALPKFDQKASFGSWLYRIAYNAAIDHHRKASRVTPINHDTYERHYDPAITGQTTSLKRLDVEAALTALSSDHRVAVMLVDAQGMSLGEAADILGVPAGTVGSRLFHARKQLRHALGAYLEEDR